MTGPALDTYHKGTPTSGTAWSSETQRLDDLEIQDRTQREWKKMSM